MKEHVSLYLDILRFGAALFVFIYHMGFLSGYYIPYIGDFGSEAVIVFFVLSGLVISHAADSKYLNFKAYISSRIARLWSIAVPALIITLIADKIGQNLDLSQYGALQPLSWWKWSILLISNALFLNQIWNLNLWPGSNGPFWSISYEFWYYLIFGIFIYLQGKSRIILAGTAALIAGPHIIVAFPAWLIGVALYHKLKKDNITSTANGIAVWLFSILALCVYDFWNTTALLKAAFPMPENFIKWEINFWPKTYIISILVALNIYGFHAGFRKIKTTHQKCKLTIRRLADCTFGLYLLHYPLGYLFKTIASLFSTKNELFYVPFIYTTTFVTSMILASFLEAHKTKAKIIVSLMINSFSRLSSMRRY